MEEIRFRVEKEGAGGRLDLYCKKKTGLSRGYIQNLIKEKKVFLNKESVDRDRRIKEADEVEIYLPDPQKLEVKPENIALKILYEDEEIILVNKDAGMLVHPTAKVYSGTLVNALLFHAKSLSGVNGILRPGIVHRLDRDTSGVMVVAKTDFSHRHLAGQFKKREVHKKYLVLVKGILNKEIECRTAYGRHPGKREKMAVLDAFLPGRNGRGKRVKVREARTKIKPKEFFDRCTLLEVIPSTGRTHQIRVHLHYLKHPVLGDTIYAGKMNAQERENLKVGRLMLHAHKLGLIHPCQNKYMEWTAPVPADMEKVIRRLREIKQRDGICA